MTTPHEKIEAVRDALLRPEAKREINPGRRIVLYGVDAPALAARLTEALEELRGPMLSEEEREAIEWTLKTFGYGYLGEEHPHAPALRSLLARTALQAKAPKETKRKAIWPGGDGPDD